MPAHAVRIAIPAEREDARAARPGGEGDLKEAHEMRLRRAAVVPGEALLVVASGDAPASRDAQEALIFGVGKPIRMRLRFRRQGHHGPGGEREFFVPGADGRAQRLKLAPGRALRNGATGLGALGNEDLGGALVDVGTAGLPADLGERLAAPVSE